MQADTKDCCHVRPTVTRAEPVFQPTRENWLENQYNGRLNLHLSEDASKYSSLMVLTKSKFSVQLALAQDLCWTIFRRQLGHDHHCLVGL